MSDSNGIKITKTPDATTKIITLDVINDGIRDADGKLQNVNLVVNGTELKGLSFVVNGEPLEYGDNTPLILLALRTPDSIATCTVRDLAAGVDAVAQIKVTGSVFADGLLTPAEHIAVWSYDDVAETYRTRLNLWAPAP